MTVDYEYVDEHPHRNLASKVAALLSAPRAVAPVALEQILDDFPVMLFRLQIDRESRKNVPQRALNGPIATKEPSGCRVNDVAFNISSLMSPGREAGDSDIRLRGVQEDAATYIEKAFSRRPPLFSIALSATMRPMYSVQSPTIATFFAKQKAGRRRTSYSRFLFTCIC